MTGKIEEQLLECRQNLEQACSLFHVRQRMQVVDARLMRFQIDIQLITGTDLKAIKVAQAEMKVGQTEMVAMIQHIAVGQAEQTAILKKLAPAEAGALFQAGQNVREMAMRSTVLNPRRRKCDEFVPKK